MKKKICCIVLTLWLLCTPAWAQDADISQEVELPAGWEEVLDEAPITAEDFKEMTLPDYLGIAARAVQGQLKAPLRLFAKLCGILLLAALAQSLSAQKPGEELTAVLDTVVTLAVFSLCGNTLLDLLEVLRSAIESSRTYLVSFIPVFASALTACGQPGGAALYSGLFFTAATFIANLLCQVMFPLSKMFLAMDATACVGGGLDLSGLAAVLRKWSKWLLGFSATVFTALMTLQGTFTQSADTVALKTGKFLLGSSIPVVGRAVSDAMGGVLAGMKLLKGTAGFAVVAVVVALFAPVLIQCFLYGAVFAAGGMVATATGAGRSAKLFSGLADCVGLYASMAFFFSFVVTSATILMILFGSGG